MTGIFEDDANVRSVKLPKSAKSTEKKQSVAKKILDKVESKSALVEAASAGSGVSFDDVDIIPGRKRKTAKSNTDSGKIIPLINYVSDSNDSIQTG